MERNLACLGALAGICLAVSCGGDDSKKGSSADGGTSSKSEGGDVSTSEGGANDGGTSSGGTNRGGTQAASGGESGEAGSGGSDSEGGRGGEPSSGNTDVHGKVFFRVLPLSNVPVVVNGVITNTDDYGEFSVPDVTAEYDVAILHPELKVAHVIEGLTTRTPIINSMVSRDITFDKKAILTGTLSGGDGFPNPASRRAQVGIVGNGVLGFSQVLNEGIAGDFSFTTTWAHDETVAADLFALQWSWDANGLTALTGYASVPLTLEDGETYGAPDTNLVLEPIEQRLVPVEVDWDDYEPSLCYAFVDVIQMPVDACDASFSVATPKGLPFKNFVRVYGSKSGTHEATVQVEVPETGGVELILPQPRTALLPVDGATGVDLETPFTWSSSEPDMVGLHQFSCDGGWEVHLASAAKSVRIPDLSKYGIPLPKGAACKWFLDAIGPASSSDAFLLLQDAFSRKTSLALYKSTGGPTRDFTTSE